MIGNQKNKDKYINISSKIAPEYADALNKICEVIGVDVYHLFQYFAYTIIRAAAPSHDLTPEIQKLMAMMESDAGWQKAFNICNPDGLKVAQCILILEQEDKKGFGAVMIDKPWMGNARQTECVDDILERVTEVTMQGVYRRLRLLGAQMGCPHLLDTLLTMIDAQILLETEREEHETMTGPADYADNGRRYGYGKKTKSVHHRTPDSVNLQQPIIFDDYDRDSARQEAADWEGERRTETGDDIEKALGCKPFGVEP